jgi:hypothetical protein
MASINEIKRKVSVDRMKRLTCFASLSALMDVLDAFEFKRNDNGETTLIAYIALFKTEIKGQNVWEFAQPLGDWLIKLPKSIWNDKLEQYNQLYKDLHE